MNFPVIGTDENPKFNKINNSLVFPNKMNIDKGKAREEDIFDFLGTKQRKRREKSKHQTMAFSITISSPNY